MNNTGDRSGFYAAVLFLIWPFLALASAFKNYRSHWAKNILWAFVAFYGFVFAIGAENENADIVRYVTEYQQLHGEDMTVATAQNYFQESGEIDIAQTLIAIVLSRFTDSQAVLTLVYGIIFGFFFSRNMWFVLERLEGRIKYITLLLFACFFLIIPIWNFNGFRMWTAAHIFLYGLWPFLFEGRKQKLLISAASILVHFSFIVPMGVLLFYLLLGNRLALYFAFFIFTFFISEINLEAFNRMIENYAPEIIQERTSGYRTEAYVEDYRQGEDTEGLVWYAIWYGRALKWSIVGFLVLLFFKGRTFFNQHRGWMNLFAFTLLFFGVSNLLASLPSGGRFLDLAFMSALVLIILYIQNRDQPIVMKRFAWVAAPALLFYIVVAFRTGLYSMSATAVMGNPVTALFLTGDHVSLNDFIKTILL